MTARQSLFGIYPRHLYVPLMIVLSAGLNIAALLLPFMETKQLIFFQDIYTLPHSVWMMWKNGYYLLAAIILCFSIVFPFLKLGSMTLLWFMRFDDAERAKYLSILSFLGKWSMLDVFVVALLLVLTESKTLLQATPRIGVYLFAAAILISMVTSFLIDHLAKNAGEAEN